MRAPRRLGVAAATAVLALTAVVLVLSWFPVRNLLSPNQKMNASFDPFRLVNTYGAFGSVSRERYEVVVEGTYELGVNNEPTRMLKAGDTFYEAPGTLHSVSRNAGNTQLKIVIFMVADANNPSTVNAQ